MTLEKFVKKTKGKKIDFDGYYGAQCVDLVRFYIYDVWELPQPKQISHAYEAYTRWLRCSDGINEISWKSLTQIAKGDLAIFPPTDTNLDGHIAIVLEVYDNEVLCFEQNGLTQRGAECKRRPIKDVYGVLTLKKKHRQG